MDQIRELIRNQEYASAEAKLRARLVVDGEDVEAKMLYGLCRRLQGDEAEFIRIDDELAGNPAVERSKTWSKYHALRVAACGTLLVLAAGTAGCSEDLGARPECVYAGPPVTPRQQQVVPKDVYAGPEMMEREKVPVPAPQPTPVKPPPKPVYGGPRQMGAGPVPPPPAPGS